MMVLSREEAAKLLVRRANLMDWIEQAQSQPHSRQGTIGYRLSLEAVEQQLRQGGVQLTN